MERNVRGVTLVDNSNLCELGYELMLYLGSDEFEFEVHHPDPEKAIPRGRRRFDPSRSPGGESLSCESDGENTTLTLYTSEGEVVLSTNLQEGENFYTVGKRHLMVFRWPTRITICMSSAENPGENYAWVFRPCRT